MISDRHKKALRILVEKLKEIDWMVVGTLALALQGVDIEPKDIDIYTDEEGAKKANELLKKFVVDPVKYSESQLFKSHFGKFMVDDVKIEVIGDLKFLIKNEEVSFLHFFHHHNLVDVDGMKVSVPYLEDQLKAYKALGMDKDLEKIKKIQDILGCK